MQELEGRDISGRACWSGLILTEAEASGVLDRLDDAFADAAARVAGRMRKKPTGEGGDGGQP